MHKASPTLWESKYGWLIHCHILIGAESVSLILEGLNIGPANNIYSRAHSSFKNLALMFSTKTVNPNIILLNKTKNF